MWREQIEKLTDECRFNLPASQDELISIEQSLDIVLPSDLKGFLMETNGVVDEYGFSLIWSTERIKHDNLKFRTHPDFREIYMPFDHLLFFADAGNGDQFAYPILNGVVRQTNIYAWDHEDDSRRWKAPSLEKFLEWLLTGKLKV